MVTIDFETEAIVGNPLVDAPRPVGVALIIDGQASYRPINGETIELLAKVWNSKEGLLFHNAPFDLSVAEQHLGLAPPAWNYIHDTQYLLFLKNPHAKTLSLKSSAEYYLSIPPDEQNELKNWILANISAKEKDWGGYISHAPFELVAKYAIGDVARTEQLFNYLHPNAPAGAYDRERRLAPILVQGTRHGIRIDRAVLERDIERYTTALNGVDYLIRHWLNTPELNIDSDTELARALKNSGVVTEFVKTPTGKDSTSKKNLKKCSMPPELMTMLEYRSSIATCLNTFMLPWFKGSEKDGRVHPNWNAVRGGEAEKIKGTRTGRLSSSDPNFQNVPNEFKHGTPEGFPAPPIMRAYTLPEEGHKWLKRDFSGQEVRILAHFEDAALQKAYKENSSLDPHQFAKEEILRITGLDYPRKNVKETAFTVIYGGSGSVIAQRLGIPDAEGYAIKAAYLAAFPGVTALQNATTNLGKRGECVVTWGGREYYAEPPKYVKGVYRRFEYKLVNYLIQGTAADQTKQCINDWYDIKDPSTVFLATVHDEINISAPIDIAEQEMTVLQTAMDQDFFDVPMRSEGFIGNNWAECK